jgi:hypothetical protein
MIFVSTQRARGVTHRGFDDRTRVRFSRTRLLSWDRAMMRRTRRGLQNNQPSKFEFALAILPALLLLFGAPDVFGNRQTDQTHEAAPSYLVIRLTKPPQWQNDCLSVSVDRINNSSARLFLPMQGLYVQMSVTEVPDEFNTKHGRDEWINVYGLSDLVFPGANPIAPGATVHKDICLSPTIGVVNQRRETHREIPLRGRLRIDAKYFLTEKEAQDYESRPGEMIPASPRQPNEMVLHYLSARMFVAIPCRRVGCKPSCFTQPLIINGEQHWVPDTLGDLDWKARGQRINDQLEKKFRACSGAPASPR